MVIYKAKCPHCGEVIESFDSQSDAYIERDAHLLNQHPRPTRPDARREVSVVTAVAGASQDQIDATKALAHRLREWNVDQAEDRAAAFIAAMVARGWRMAATERALRRPPMKSEECRTHPGEWRDFCRSCVAERKAARDAAPKPDGQWTPERIRAAIGARGEGE